MTLQQGSFSKEHRDRVRDFRMYIEAHKAQASKATLAEKIIAYAGYLKRTKNKKTGKRLADSTIATYIGTLIGGVQILVDTRIWTPNLKKAVKKLQKAEKAKARCLFPDAHLSPPLRAAILSCQRFGNLKSMVHMGMKKNQTSHQWSFGMDKVKTGPAGIATVTIPSGMKDVISWLKNLRVGEKVMPTNVRKEILAELGRVRATLHSIRRGGINFWHWIGHLPLEQVAKIALHTNTKTTRSYLDDPPSLVKRSS